MRPVWLFGSMCPPPESDGRRFVPITFRVARVADAHPSCAVWGGPLAERSERIQRPAAARPQGHRSERDRIEIHDDCITISLLDDSFSRQGRILIQGP